MAKVIPLTPVSVKSYDPSRDGVTFSLLSKFKNCREFARLYLKGWKPKSLGMGIVFGSITHSLFQQVYEDVRAGKLTKPPSTDYVKKHVAIVEKQWREDNPKADSESLERLEVTCIIAESVLPMYFQFWAEDFKTTWNKPETEFRHAFQVEHPFTRKTLKTFLRGKIDASFLTKPNAARPWLFETKTKSRIGEQGETNLTDILPHEMQVGIYLIILMINNKGKAPAGLLYNIVRRPSVKPKKNENLKAFAQRIIADVRKRPEYYFLRLRMTVDAQDLNIRYEELEDTVADFLMWWKGEIGHYKNSDYCENKYGTCSMLPICGRRDFSRHYRSDRIFSELEEV
jgi:hypothetical protein